MSVFASVQQDEEFDRVFAIPRRPVPDPTSPESLALAREVTARMKRVAVPHPFRSETDTLFATQALALKELYEARGLLAPIRVGGGKSLLAYLAIAIMRPARPMLIVPASMVADTRAQWALFERDWRGPRLADVAVLSYEKVSVPGSGAKVLPDGTEIYGDIISRHKPDMIVCDEVHRFGSVSATGTRRIGRYLETNLETVFLGMSGTLIRRSLKDAAHIAQWALGDNAPLPVEWMALQAWADACDARSGANGKRTDYGALLDQLSPAERREFDSTDFPDDARGVVCGMLGRRILETPGVVGSNDGPLSIPARLDPKYLDRQDPAIEEEYARLLDGDGDRPQWSLPDGQLLPDARSLARPLTTLSYGLYLMQDPLPPPEYRGAASTWAKGVREVVKYRSHLKLDSEWQVRDAVQRGVLPDLAEDLQNWLDAQRAYRERTGLREPPSVPTWISDEVVHNVKRWLDAGTGVVWVSYVALGQRLSKELGIPYFGAEKKDGKGRHVTKLKVGEPAVLSIASVGTGTDGLQHRHHRALWLGTPSEQALARLHRPGQDADEVLNDIYVGSAQLHTRYLRAKGVAVNFAGAMSGSAQKLAYFRDEVPRTLELEGRRFGAAAEGEAGEDA